MGASAPSGYRSSGVWNDCSAGAPLPSPAAARFAIVLVLFLVRCSLLDRLLRLVYFPRHLAIFEEAQGTTARTQKSCVTMQGLHIPQATCKRSASMRLVPLWQK